MKNYLLDLLKGEINLINHKEDHVSKALKESETRLEKDSKEFKVFMDKEKHVQKFNENILAEITAQNKKLSDKKKKLNQKKKELEDDLDRTVKMILNLKNNASFVYNVMGGKFISKNCSIFIIIIIINNNKKFIFR